MDVPLETVVSRPLSRVSSNAGTDRPYALQTSDQSVRRNTQDTSGYGLSQATSGSSIRNNYDISESTEHSIPEPVDLAPADRGLQAWMYLVGAFVVETLVWGFPNSFGIFLSYYSEMYRDQPGAELLLPLAGTLCSGLIYCSGPILYPIVARYPSRRRTSMWAGNVICFGSLFGASYVNKPWQIVLLQGVGYGLGGSLLYAPTVSYMSEWFFARRGLANGVMNAGTAVGGLVLPLVLPSVIRQVYSPGTNQQMTQVRSSRPNGTRVTLRYLSIAVFASLSAVLPFIRPRLPEDRVRSLALMSNARWSTNKSFWLVLFVTTLQGFAYFLPILYLPTFAKDMNLSDSQASFALALLNGSSVISRISLGQLSDVLNPWLLSTFTLAATSIFTFVLWGAVATSIGTLSVYAALFGALAGGFSSLWTGFVRPIAKDDPTSATTMLGMLMLSRGLGNVLSTPLSSVLLTGSVLDYVHSGLQHGNRWGRLIVYIGTVFAGAAAVGVVGWKRDGGLNSILLRRT